MRLVIFGLTVSSSWGNGHATIWRGLCSALARQNHQVTFFERDVPYYANHRDLSNADDYELVLYQDWADIQAVAREVASGGDSGIVTSYRPAARAAADLILDSRAPMGIFYDPDPPVTLERRRAGAHWEYA